MKSWKEYIKEELKKEPGILELNYPYTFLWKPVPERTIKDIWKGANYSKEKIVYIHIPFCERKCLFCNFVAYFHSPYSLISKYIKYLKKEMQIILPLTSSLVTDSLCIGGGTPNILKEKELGDILRMAHKLMNLRKGAEISIEIYPDESINAGKLRLLKDHGVSRVSFGIQSFDNKIKRICNRSDTSTQNIAIYNSARKIGFNKINFDLIFGLPYQTPKSWLNTLGLTVKLGPEHISIHSLCARHSKILFYKYTKNMEVKKSIDTFNFTRNFLTQRGYLQISRFRYVKRGINYSCNDGFSSLAPALGLGLNSVSYNSGFTYKNTLDLKQYFSALENNKLPVEKAYILKGKDRMRNYIIRKITYLRIDREEFVNNFGSDIRSFFGKVVRELIKFNLIKADKKYIELTQKGIFYTALVKRCFYDFKILKAKEKFYRNISRKQCLE